MSKNSIVALLHALSGAFSIFISFISRGHLAIQEQPIKSIGFLVFGSGALLFAYSAQFLRTAFQGNVEPITSDLVTRGPYKVIRHPLYLAMIIMSLGLAIGMRSMWGIGLTLIVFLPLCIYRAKLEEGALRVRFRQDWDEYAAQTAFMIPYIY